MLHLIGRIKTLMPQTLAPKGSPVLPPGQADDRKRQRCSPILSPAAPCRTCAAAPWERKWCGVGWP